MELPPIKNHMLVNSSPNEGGPCVVQPRRMTKITRIPQRVSCEPLLSYQSSLQSGVEAGQEIGLIGLLWERWVYMRKTECQGHIFYLGSHFIKGRSSRVGTVSYPTFYSQYFIKNIAYNRCYINAIKFNRKGRTIYLALLNLILLDLVYHYCLLSFYWIYIISSILCS